MKSPEKKTKSQRIAELERKLYESGSYHNYRHHFASKALETVLSPVFDRVANTFVESFVARAEAVYGPR